MTPPPSGWYVPAPMPVAPKPKSRAGLIAGLVVFAVLFVAAFSGGFWLFLELTRTQSELEDAEQRIRQQQQHIDEQNEIIDEKQVFGQAMTELMDAVRQLDGAPTASLIPMDDIDRLAQEAWQNRRSVSLSRNHANRAREHTAAMRELREQADAEASVNASGTLAETLLDELGAGFVSMRFGDATAICEQEASGCVVGNTPTIVHLDQEVYWAEYYDDWLRTFLTYHEFAHVLQFTNPEATAIAEPAFDDDWEFMADCYALTMTDSWTLDRRVWRNSFSYWDVSIGYGRVCDAEQRDVIRDWLGQVGFIYRPVSS